MVNEIELRCDHCTRLLAKGAGKIRIKCPKCKTMNCFNHNQDSHQTERQRAPMQGVQYGNSR
ncbi:Com family DNA-binding transcriptional regulator [Candidatus Magnetaquicoccus inordinatus]|uniref:Com family DNA-binding transcriptional regulator n=1 Tax=Candidatus Magnetaquicoccus inordinatus TaxID=2496818 RepID=UPI00102C0628